MKLYFTIIMGILAGLLHADSCDDVNHENLPGGKGWRDFQNPLEWRDFVRELENYRKSLCDESEANCIWRPGKVRPGEIIRAVCEKRFKNGNGNGKKNDEQITKKVTSKKQNYN